MDDLSDLPKSVAEIAEVIGRTEALLLLGSLPLSGSRPGRKCLYVPKRRLAPDHELVKLLGWGPANSLQRAFAGEILQLSNVRFWAKDIRNQRIREMHDNNHTLDEISEEMGLSKYRVREILAGDPPEARATQ